VPSLNFHYTTFCRPGGGRDPGPGWIPAFAGMTNRTGLLGFQPCSLVTSFARQHTSCFRRGLREEVGSVDSQRICKAQARTAKPDAGDENRALA